jgi:hypothetical protein
MSNRLTLFGLVLLLIGLLALVASGLVRETLIVPLLFLLWLADLVLQSIPQAALWLLFLLLALPLLWRSLDRPRPIRFRTPPASTPRAPVAAWADLFGRAERDHYGRWLLAQRLSQLAFTLLASPEQRGVSNPWRVLQDQTLEVPAEIRAYLRAGARSYQAPAVRRGWRADPSVAASPDPLDLDPKVVLSFLERWHGRESAAD